jgi:5-methylcytosine-specific restriction endonuclease McrA
LNAGTDGPRQRGRYIPVAIRRAVRQRDEHRCTFVSDEGRRCCEVSRLEFHHITPFARLREHTAEGITSRCRAHHALAAEQDFGREKILSKRHGTRHEAFARQRG